MSTFDAGDRRELLRLARLALQARVSGAEVPVRAAASGKLAERASAFVTILNGGELRGCLGSLAPDRPLVDTILHLGAVVADSDPRFEPVSHEEVGVLLFEISVLTPEREIQSVDDIEVGRHGLIVEQGARRGLLLPQVATEHGWDRDTFLAHACRKAGLPETAWRHGARVFIFEAEVMSDREFMNRDA